MTASAVAVFALISIAHGQDASARGDVDLQGKLYRAVFYTGPGTLSPADLAAVPEPHRERLSRFLARRAAFKSRYAHDAGSFEQARVDAKKRDIERAIVGLVDVQDVEARAVAFVSSARIDVDWKGGWKGPLGEATAAEAFLKENPSSPLAPYVYVFIAHRQRAAFEAYARAQDVEGMKAASRKYRTFVQRARAAADPIFRMVADDLDRQAHVYVKTDQHPATFDPDA